MVQNLSENFRTVDLEDESLIDHFIDTVSIRLLGCGVRETEAGVISNFMLPDFLIVHYMSGTVSLRHGEAMTVLTPDSFYIFRPDEIYTGVRLGDEPLRFSYLFFDMAPFLERYNFSRLALSAADGIFQSEKYRRFGRMLDEFADDVALNPGRPAMLRQLVRYAAAQLVYDRVAVGGDFRIQNRGRESKLVNRAYQYVSAHLAEPIVIGDIIRDAETSKTSLDRAFRSLLGTTPQRALMRYKIERSMEMLQQNLTSKSIAKELGFNSVYHFSNTFKAVTGIRPTEYQLRALTSLDLKDV